MSDISEERGELFHQIVESAPLAMLLVDGQGKIKLVNNFLEELLHYNRTELIESPVDLILPGNYKDQLLALARNFLFATENKDFSTSADTTARQKDGTSIPVEIKYKSVTISGVSYDLLTLTDLRKRKKIEARLNALFQHNIDAIVLLDQNGCITYVSPAIERIMGFSQEEMLGKNGSDYFHPDEMDIVAGRMKAATEHPGKAIYTQNRVRHKNGHYIDTEGTTTNFLEDKNIKAFVGNFRDITDRKAAEEKLVTANRIYAFISAINQAIAHNSDQPTLFNEACRIAIEIGKFDLAFIARLDFSQNHLEMVAHYNTIEEDHKQFGCYTFGEQGLIGDLVTNGKSSFVNDYDSTPFRKQTGAYISKRGFKSSIALAIRLGGQISYSFHIFSKRKDLFDSKEVKLLQEIADDLSFALSVFEKERLRTEAEERTKKANRLYAFISAINQTIVHVADEQELFEQTCHIAATIGHFDLALIVRPFPEKHTAELVAQANATPSDLEMFGNFNYEANGAIATVLQTGKYAYIDDYKKGPQTNAVVIYALKRGMRSGIVLPLTNGGKVVYLMCLMSARPNLFDTQEIGILEEVTQDLAFALGVQEKEKLRREAEEKKNQANRLYAFISAINQAIAYKSDEQTLFYEACRIAVEIGQFEMAFIARLDYSTFQLELQAQYNATKDDLRTFGDYSFEANGLIHQLIMNGKSAVVNDFETTPFRKQTGKYIVERGLKSGIALAIKQGGVTAYSFHLFSKNKNLFDAQEVKLLEEITDDLSFALSIFEKEILRREAEDRKIQANRLYAFISAINKAIAHHTDELELFNEACKIAVETGGFDMAFIGRLDFSRMNLKMIAGYNTTQADIDVFGDYYFEETGLIYDLVKNGRSTHINDYSRLKRTLKTGDYVYQRGFNSNIILSIYKDGRIAFSMHIFSRKQNLFDSQEISLLEEVAEDLSFAMDIFEKEKRRREADEKLIHANRLYAFISQVNHSIVHIDNELDLFNEACRIAVETGKFELAYILVPDTKTKTVLMVAHNNASESDVAFLNNKPFREGGLADTVLRNGRFSVINDFENTSTKSSIIDYALSRGFRSVISLPIKKAAVTCYLFFIFSTHKNLFDQHEIELLQQTASDLSFALDVFDKENNRKEAERKQIHANRLYAFISQINQAIVHVSNEQELFDHACKIAVETGKFELAYINSIDRANQLAQVRAHNNASTEDLLRFDNQSFAVGGLTDSVIHFGDYAIINNFETVHNHNDAIEYAKTRGLGSCIGLPLKKNKQVSYIFYIYSNQKNFFDRQEIELLTRTANDLSFALDVFEKESSRKEAEENLVHVNRLYAFISQINQAIVRLGDERTVFAEACRIAIEFGKFQVAWIALIDKTGKRLKLAGQSGMTQPDLSLFTEYEIEPNSITDHVIRTGMSYTCNNIQRDPLSITWHAFARLRLWRSCMTLPIRKSGVVTGTFYLVSDEINFFDSDEINLLEEAASDISFALDVFEKDKLRKQSEQNLIHSEFRLNQAQSMAHIGSWELDFASGQGLWSDETCRIYGVPLGENSFSQADWESFIHPDELEYVQKISTEELAVKGSTAFHHRIVRRNGDIRHVYSQASIDTDAAGIPVGMVGAVHDITDTRIAEIALARTETNLRIIMDLIPQSIFAKAPDGRYLFVNKSFAALYGMTPEELVGKRIQDAIPRSSESALFQQQDQDVILSGQSVVLPEVTFTDYQGNIRVFNTLKIPFAVAGPNEIASLGIANEITEQKQIELERTRMIADIIQRNKDLEQFSYIVSHNLRAPVANIIGLTEILQIPELDKIDSEKLIADMAVCVGKLDEVIIDLNYVLQIKTKQGQKKEKIRLSRILKDIKISIDPQIKSENVQLLTNFNEIDEIYTVKSYIHSIFYNLISNSIKYRQPDINPIIAITTAYKNNTVAISYKDNGMGIDLAKRGSQVFGLYKRFHDHVEGKGMGLFMVKTQVESLGGKISIESEVNKGTRFLIEFEAAKSK